MTTFSSDGFKSSTSSGSNPAQVTFASSELTVGNYLIVLAHERSGTTEANYTLSDGGSGETWADIAGVDSQLGDSNYRHSARAWGREIVSGDTSGFTLSIDNGTANGIRVYTQEVAPSAAYAWEFVEAASATSETSDWDNLNSGNTGSISSTDNFEWVGACSRVGPDLPSAVAFDTQTDGANYASSGNHTYQGAVAFEASGQGTGVKSAQLAVTGGSGNEGIIILGVWKAAASGSTGTGALTLPAQTASGAGTRDISGTGAPSLPATTASGTGARAVTGTGAPALPAVQASGAGTRDVAGTGAPTLPAVTASGAGTRAVTGTGALDLPAMTLSGSGTGGSAVIGDSGVPEDDDDEVMRMVIREFRKIAA